MADYRKTLKDHIQKSGNWTGHPWTQIDMQIHHLISKKGYSLSKFSSRLKKYLESVSYDIDTPQNLVALPSEYRGACHLEVQLHRGNHPEINGQSYHQIVEGLVDGKFQNVKNDTLCKHPERAQKMMNQISKNLIKRIDSFDLPLTKDGIHRSFKEGEKSGCRNLAIGGSKKQFTDKEDVFKDEGNKSINETCCTTDNRTKYRDNNEQIKMLDFVSKDRKKPHYDIKTPHELKVGN